MKLQSHFISLVKRKLPSPTLCCCRPAGFRELAFLIEMEEAQGVWMGPTDPYEGKGCFWSPHFPATSPVQVIGLQLIGHS